MLLSGGGDELLAPLGGDFALIAIDLGEMVDLGAQRSHGQIEVRVECQIGNRCIGHG